MAAMLEKRGFVVSAAEGFQDAMAKFQAAGLHGFDCVVTDYLMPDGNGIDLLHWLRKKDSAIATIVVTMEREKSLVLLSCSVCRAVRFIPQVRSAYGGAVPLGCL